MATLRQIVGKALELKTAFDSVSALQTQRDAAAQALATLDAALASAQATQATLSQQLKTLVNEP